MVDTQIENSLGLNMHQDILHIFTDGSCKGNGSVKATAGIGIYFGDKHPMNVSEALEATSIHTNNSAELTAILRAIKLAGTNKSIIYSDSEYSINSVTDWYKQWELSDWTSQNKQPIQNKCLIQNIVMLLKQNPQISLLKVKAHAKEKSFYQLGNKEADRLANEGREHQKYYTERNSSIYKPPQSKMHEIQNGQQPNSTNKRHHEVPTEKSFLYELNEIESLQQFKRLKKESVKRKIMLSLNQSWPGFISENFVPHLTILLNSRLEFGIAKRDKQTDEIIFRPLFPQYYQQRQKKLEKDTFTLNQTNVWFHWSQYDDTPSKLRVITTIQNEGLFRNSWQKTSTGDQKLNDNSLEAVYAFDIEFSTIKNISCYKNDLKDGAARVEMFVFMTDPCKVYRLIQYKDKHNIGKNPKCSFGRINSILKDESSEFVNSWNRKQVMKLEFVTKCSDFDAFYKKCSTLKSFVITNNTHGNISPSIISISDGQLDEFYYKLDQMAKIFDTQIIRNPNLKFQLQFMILCMLSTSVVSIWNPREYFLSYLITQSKNTQQAKKAASTVEVIIQIRNSLKNKDDLHLIQVFNEIYSNEEHTKFKHDAHSEQNINVFKEHRIYKSPTIDFYETPQIAQSNHILRKFIKDKDMFVKVYFVDESRQQGFYCFKSDVQSTNFIYNTIVDGFSIGYNRCNFVGCSPSQLKMHSINFYATTIDNNYTIKQIRDSQECFKQLSTQTSVGQVMLLLARLGQLFTSSKYICDIERKIEEIDDIERNNYSFSDGCGFMSLSLCKDIQVHQKLKFLPTAVQIRVGGCKGILILSKELDPQATVIQVRNSQIKFKHTSSAFNLVRIAQFSQGYLNSQIIVFLEQLGVPQKVFLQLLEDQCNKITMMTTQCINNQYKGLNSQFSSSIRYLSSVINLAIKSQNVEIFNDPCISQILHTLQVSLLTQIKDKQRICVNRSCNLIGVIDPYEILEEGEVFIQICKNINTKKEKMKCQVIIADVLVTRHPTPEMKDIRLLKAVCCKQLMDYLNVIIFSSKGQRPAQSEMANGDLDGDIYFIIYDQQIVEFITIDKLQEPSKQKDKLIQIDHDVEYKDFSDVAKIATGVVKFFQHDLMRVSYGLLQSYFERFGANHKDTVWLAQFYIQCIDLSKRANIPDKQKFFDLQAKFGHQYPDYVRKGNTYESIRAAGVIFRKMQASTQYIDHRRIQWEYSIKLKYEFSETLISNIQELCPYFEQLQAQIIAPFTKDLKDLMVQHSLCCEGELFIFQRLLKQNSGVFDLYEMDQLISDTLHFLVKTYKEKLKNFQRANSLEAQVLSQGLYFLVYYHPDIKIINHQVQSSCIAFINSLQNKQSEHMLQPVTNEECEVWKKMQVYDTYCELLANIQRTSQYSQLVIVLKFTKLLSIPWLLSYKPLLEYSHTPDQLNQQTDNYEDYYDESGDENMEETGLPTWF